MYTAWQQLVRSSVAAGLLALAGTASGCGPSLRVRTDYDPEVSFKSFHVYAWTDSNGVRTDTTVSPFLERRIRRAVDRYLADRGFVATVFGNPDFLVTAFVVGPAEQDTRWRTWRTAPCGPVVTFGYGVGYPYGYSVHHHRWNWPTPYFRQPWGYVCSYQVGYGYLWLPVYEEPVERLAGTLMIDVLDPLTNELVWRGSAEGAVFAGGQQAPTQEELDDIVGQILREFPPGTRH
jgi:hypothetical protein